MSKLQDDERIYCTSCNNSMNDILLCRTRSNAFDENDRPCKRRCTMIVCKYCDICDGCQYRIHELELKLKRARHRQENQLAHCDKIIADFKQQFDCDV